MSTLKNIGNKPILEVASSLKSSRQVTTMVLARLVFVKRLRVYELHHRTKCLDLRHIAGDVNVDEVKAALGETGYPGSLTALSRSRYLYYEEFSDRWHDERERRRVNARFRQLIDYPAIADLGGRK